MSVSEIILYGALGVGIVGFILLLGRRGVDNSKGSSGGRIDHDRNEY